nr:TRAM domain-containing protein [Lachnospiraceae bacterium]
MKKNDTFEITIEDVSVNGEGIGHFDGMTFFIKGAIPGDRALCGVTKLKKKYGFARVIEILEASKDRIEPKCAMAGRCGGCQIMQMDYPAQLSLKENLVREKLLRIGGFTEDKV